MRSVIFKVKVPIPDKEGEYKEFEFNSPEKVCEMLNIPVPTLYAITQGRIKFTHESLKHLANIKIEKISIPAKNPRKKKKPVEVIEEERKTFEKKLYEKLEAGI